jgi:exonuclease III
MKLEKQQQQNSSHQPPPLSLPCDAGGSSGNSLTNNTSLNAMRNDKEKTKDKEKAKHKEKGKGKTRNNRQQKCLSRQERLKLATFNTRTLRGEMRQGELCKLAEERQLSVVAIQEHRIVTGNDEDATTIDMDAGWTFELVSATKQGQGGIGFLLSPKAHKMNPVVRVISPRIALLTISLQRRKLHIVCAYSPTAPSTAQNPDDTNDFMALLLQTVQQLPVRDITLLAGDLNATLPERTARVFFTLGKENTNTPLLVNLLEQTDMFPLNAGFQKPLRKLVTFNGPRSRLARLDYICITRNWRHVVEDCSTIRPLIVVSDHSLVFCKLVIKNNFPPVKKGRTQKRIYWPSLREEKTRVSFAENVHSMLSSKNPTYEELKNAIIKTAEEKLPKMERKPHNQCIWKENTKVAAQRQQAAAVARITRKGVTSTKARNKLEEIYTNTLEEQIAEQICKINSLHDQRRNIAVWKAIDHLSGRKARTKVRIQGESEDKKAEILMCHFQELLNNPSNVQSIQCPSDFTSPQVTLSTEPITIKELQAAAKTMASYKAPGPDNIPAAVFKTEVLQHLLPIMNAILLEDALPPKDWLIADIIPIPKKGNLTLAINYRGISLMSTAAKLFNKVLLRRLLPLDEHLLPVQCGFRKGRGTAEQVLALRLIIDRLRTRQQTAIIIFIDFTKAFDSVNRQALKEILLLYSVPPTLTKAIMKMHEGTSSRVKLPTATSAEFPTTTGVLQGDTLAPFLFILVVDFILRDIFNNDELAFRVTTGGHSKIGALAYADDIALIAKDPAAGQTLVDKLSASAAKIGLLINQAKTEYMVFPKNLPHDPIKISGKSLKLVSTFTYLGVEASDSRAALVARKNKAWAAAVKLNSIFTSSVKEKLKVLLFRATVESVLLYCIETHAIPKTLAKELDANHSALLRYALGIHWPQKVSNRDLYKRADCPTGSQIARQRRLKLYGHVTRHKNVSPAGMILSIQPKEKFRVGGHKRITFEKVIEEDMELLEINKQMVTDVKAWNEECNKALWK